MLIHVVPPTCGPVLGAFRTSGISSGDHSSLQPSLPEVHVKCPQHDGFFWYLLPS